MAGVEEELWNIFTFYALRGNPLDLTRLSGTQFLRLARDCQIVDEGSSTISGSHHGGYHARAVPRLERRSERRIGQAEVNLAFASIIQGRSKVPPEAHRKRNIKSNGKATTTEVAAQKCRLTYPEFLDALVVLGERMYRTTVPKKSKPPSPDGRSSVTRVERQERSVESNFQQVLKTRMKRRPKGEKEADLRIQQLLRRAYQWSLARFILLLMEHVLPLASRRRPTSITDAKRDPLVRDLLRHYRPALRELFRFYAVSPSAALKSTPTIGSSYHNSGAGESGEDPQRGAPDAKGEKAGRKTMVVDLGTPTVPSQQPDVPSDTTATTATVGVTTTTIATAPSASPSTITTSATIAPAAATPEVSTKSVVPASAPSPFSNPAPAASHVNPALAANFPAGDDDPANSCSTAPISQPPPAPTSRCPSSITWSVSHEGMAEATVPPNVGEVRDGCARSGSRGGNSGGRGGRGDPTTRRRRRPQSAVRHPSSRYSYATRLSTMNSMADALSHQCLLWFTSDFGISGALLSALEVGEVFLSCHGGLDDHFDEGREADDGSPYSKGNHGASLACIGKGRVRPLTFPEFLEALVRMSLACFRRKTGKQLDAHQEGCDELLAPGQCFRALLAHMWWKLHDSSELALNGVREGGTRHRSSIQKGALLKGVQLFNEQMLSDWRAGGYIEGLIPGDAVTSTDSVVWAATLRPSPRQGCAAEMLRAMLALDTATRGDCCAEETGGLEAREKGSGLPCPPTNTREECGAGGARGP